MHNYQFRSQSQNQSKSSISQNRIPPPSSCSNGIKMSKRNINNSSSHSISSINVNKNLDFKDSLEGSISESRTNLLIPDSLNNTKSSIGNNYLSKKNSKNKIKLKNNNIEENGIKLDQNINNEEKTKKIDYRFYSHFSFKFGGGDVAKNKEKEKNKYWLAVYDKLMKTKKILKILSYYEKEKNKIDKMINNNINNNQENIKEQLLIIKDFDIYFMKPLNRPFIKYVKGNCIFTKIYLLTFEQIIFILNYINRYKLAISSKISNLLLQKGSYQKINETYKNFPYNLIYGMGSYMNINIIGFSNYNIQEQNNLSFNSLNQNYPNSRKIAKLVKLLMINFPKYSFKFFVCYLLSKIRFENFEEKTNEIKNIVYSTNKSYMPLKPKIHKKIISNSLIHSSYSPLSNYDDSSFKIQKNDANNYFKENINNNIYNNNTNNINNYNNICLEKNHRIKSNNLSKEFHTFDNRVYKYYKTNKENKMNIIKITNYSNKTKNLSEQKNIFKKHSESLYLNGYIGTANNMNHSTFNKSRVKKGQKEIKTSIKHLINNFNSSRTSINKNRKRLNKSEMLKVNKYSNNINYIQVKNEKKENGINKQKEKKGTDIFNVKNNFNNYKEDKLDEKIKSKKRNKLITNTRTEETKICSTNKEANNNSIREINKENTGIFVVSKKIITDDFLDDDSSIELNSKRNENNNSDINNGQSVEYFTPEKRKKYKYYS